MLLKLAAEDIVDDTLQTRLCLLLSSLEATHGQIYGWDTVVHLRL